MMSSPQQAGQSYDKVTISSAISTWLEAPVFAELVDMGALPLYWGK